MKIDILHKGDKVLNVTAEFVAVERKNHEVDIIPIISDGNAFRVDTDSIITIGFGENVVSAETDNGVTITCF